MRYTDQLGEHIELDATPSRIVSLVPSQTELLFDLGVGERVVGVTRYCTDPADALESVTRVGGTKRFDFPAIEGLAPDLVLGNKEENYQEGIERLRAHYPVWMSDIYDLDDALAMIEQIAAMVDAEARGRALCDGIRERFGALDGTTALQRAAYFIWRKPYMVVGGHNFIDDLMRRAGFHNVFGDLARYPEVDPEQIRKARPDVLLLSSEPFPFTESHRREFEALVPGAEVLLVDGTLFSWYGSRLLRVPAYLQSVAGRLSRNVNRGVA